MNPARTLITAALPYANGKIHLGHLAGAYLPADIYARYLRSTGAEILFVCGSDEHGVPITITAEKEGITPAAVVDRYHALNREAFARFGMSFDVYSRTSSPLHHRTASEFFLKLHGQGVLLKKDESQLYDEQAKMFLPDRYVEGTCPVCKNAEARGDQCEQCGTFLNPTELINPKSKITGNTPAVRKTSHWYFPLGKYQKRLESYIAGADKRDGWKQNVLQYCQSWFREGLQDRAVTRDLQWGVRVPLEGFENKVLYVWFDAVLGYISAAKEWAGTNGTPDRWREYWQSPGTKYVAFIGKDNVVFHCIVFPAMLMAWNDSGDGQYILPENVPANEFLNFESRKFSKSRGWGIDVDEFLDLFPADSLRYALATTLPETRDADFTWRDFQARHNNELADILGNFVNRTVTFAHTHFDGKVPGPAPDDGAVTAEIEAAAGSAAEAYESYRFRDGTACVMNLARFANKYFNDRQPWKMVKTDRAGAAQTIAGCLRLSRALAILLEPVLPATSARIWKILNLTGSPLAAGWAGAVSGRLEAGRSINNPEILFAKLEDSMIEKMLKSLPQDEMAKPDPGKTAPAKSGPESSGPAASGTAGLLDIDEFKKTQLRVARVISAERVPKSDRLLKLQVSLGGTEQRQIIAGIAAHYEPEKMVGRKIVIVANLKPASIMGHRSEGMLLAASDGDGRLSILMVDGDAPEGSPVR